jgi:small GTP-binding protein
MNFAADFFDGNVRVRSTHNLWAGNTKSGRAKNTSASSIFLHDENMSSQFPYDVFLSHSSKDKPVVRAVAERLRKDGLKVWFDEWVIKPGDSIPAKIEEGLEHSHVLVLCMSANAFGSDWAQLEAGTFRFRDPLNKDRRFLTLRLDEAPIKGSLSQFLYINWLPANGEIDYSKLLEGCRPQAQMDREPELEEVLENVTGWDNEDSQGRLLFAHDDSVYAIAISPDGKWVIADTVKARLKKIGLNTETKRSLRKHGSLRQVESSPLVRGVVVTPNGKNIVSCSSSPVVEIWDFHEMKKVRRFQCDSRPTCVSMSSDGTKVVAGLYNGTIRIWDFLSGKMICRIQAHSSAVKALVVTPNDSAIVSGSEDNSVRLWTLATGRQQAEFIGHSNGVTSLAITRDGKTIVSGSHDKTIRIWDSEAKSIAVFEGHTSRIFSLAVAPDDRMIVSGSSDKTVRVWDLKSGECLHVFRGHSKSIRSIRVTPDGRQIVSGSVDGTIRVWPLNCEKPQSRDAVRLYTNAKVLLVGESGAGKTGLSKRLALNDWQPSDSTVGAWATQWKLPVSSDDGVEREIWLWDFGGQADQRLIHQLYMDETALAVLVFDGQKEDLFDTLGQWDRDLTRASQKTFTKLLVAGRVDAGGLRASRSQLETFKKERGYLDFLETSAKSGLRCDELKQAILNGIRWEDIPWRSSPVLFKRLKEEIIKLKDADWVLMRFNELREALQLRLSGELTRFTDDELKAVVSLLSGPGVVWELKFGSWVLLQPGRINAYAQAVIQTMREDEKERGCLPEERVLGGDLTYHRPEERLPADEERFVLLAMHKILVERGLCLREHTDTGTMLIFPSYYRRERPELVGHPAALVSYRFSGFLDEIYATLVVRLHHTKPFTQDQLWRYAADFKTLTGKQLGVKLERRAEGAGELVVYADPKIADEEKIIFSRYVHEHILQKGRDMVRLRHYGCPHCGTPVGNREVAMERLNAWLTNQPAGAGLAGKIRAAKKKLKAPTIVCSKCEKRVPLWDELEQYFASDEVKKRVRQLQAESDLVLDNESKDRALVGDVISTVALAGQIIEEYSAKRYGLDMEIEFKDDDGKPTAKKLYLQLKSGDSHLRKRERDGAEIFQIHHEDHAKYWMEQAYPVFLVIGNSEGEVHWMEIRDYLKRESDNGKKPAKQIVFAGERFDVMSVRRWREKALSERHSPS